MSEDIGARIQRMQEEFKAKVPARLQNLAQLFAEISGFEGQGEAIERLRMDLHRLAGGAGTLGQPGLGLAARATLNRLNDWVASGGSDTAAWSNVGDSLRAMASLQLAEIQAAGAERLLSPMAASLSRANPACSVAVVDDDVESAMAWAARLERAGYHARVFGSTDDFERCCDEEAAPDVALIDLDFSNGRLAGAELMARLRRRTRGPSISMVVSSHDDVNARLAAYRAGACRYFTKPLDIERMLAELERMTSGALTAPYRVLIVDDDPRLASVYGAVLESAGMQVELLSQPLAVWDRIQSFDPDVLVLDVFMPEASGPELAAVLRENDDFGWMPILFLSAESDPIKQVMALAQGGDEFLMKPVKPNYLVAVVQARAWRARRSRAAWQWQAGQRGLRPR